MSEAHVVPDRSISSAASRPPSYTNSGDTSAFSSGQILSVSQRIKGRSSPTPRSSVIAACVWALTKPGVTAWRARWTTSRPR